jgi:hypothetical protein
MEIRLLYIRRGSYRFLVYKYKSICGSLCKCRRIQRVSVWTLPVEPPSKRIERTLGNPLQGGTTPLLPPPPTGPPVVCYGVTFTFRFTVSNNNTMEALTSEAPATLAPFNVGPEVMYGNTSPKKNMHLILKSCFGVESRRNATFLRNVSLYFGLMAIYKELLQRCWGDIL